MLFFCLLVAVIGPFLVEEDDRPLIILIGVGLGIFLALIAFIITKFRVYKLKKGSKLVMLSKKGAYVLGTFHFWGAPASFSHSIELEQKQNGTVIEIEYSVLTMAGPNTTNFFVPVPENLIEEAKKAVEIMKSKG